MSIFQLDRGLVPLGSLLMGVLASAVGAQYALFTLAGCAVVLVALVAFLTPGFRKLKVSFDEEAVAHHGRGISSVREKEPPPSLAKAPAADD